MPARPAVPDDAPHLVRLGVLMFDSMGIDTSGVEWRERAEALLRDGLASGLVGAWVVDHDGRPVASAVGTVAQRLPGPRNPSGRAGYVQYVATEEAHRRRGYGRNVMSSLLAWYRARDVRVVELHATAAGEPLYRELGFSDGDNPALRARLA